MSGRKTFDMDEAIDAAMMAFWRAGYEATSLADLVAATGLNKSSLYNTFESKERLFVRCLDRYSERYSQAMLDELDAPDFRKAIEAFFLRILSRFDDETLPSGCLATMTTMEVIGRHEAVATRLANGVRTLQQAFAMRIEKAIVDDDVPADLDSEAISGLLAAVARGIAVLDRSERSRNIANLAIQGMLSMIDGITRSKQTREAPGQSSGVSAA